MSRATSVLRFETPTVASTNISIRITKELSERIESVRARAKAAGATFDASGVVRAALVDACKTAERELSRIGKSAA